jgi:hypothetical protein
MSFKWRKVKICGGEMGTEESDHFLDDLFHFGLQRKRCRNQTWNDDMNIFEYNIKKDILKSNIFLWKISLK